MSRRADDDERRGSGPPIAISAWARAAEAARDHAEPRRCGGPGRARSSSAGSSTLDLDEAELVDRFLAVLERLLPGRAVAVRVIDLRSREPARAYVRGARLRDGIDDERVTAAPRPRSAGAAQERGRGERAAPASASRWDSPFTGIATGFAVPLAAAGELYGVLDVGYAPGPGVDAAAATIAGDVQIRCPANRSRSRCARYACSATTRRPARLPGAPARAAPTR